MNPEPSNLHRGTGIPFLPSRKRLDWTAYGGVPFRNVSILGVLRVMWHLWTRGNLRRASRASTPNRFCLLAAICISAETFCYLQYGGCSPCVTECNIIRKSELCFIQPIKANQCELSERGVGGGTPAECVTHQSPRPGALFGLLCLDKADWFALNPVIYAKLSSWWFSLGLASHRRGSCHKRDVAKRKMAHNKLWHAHQGGGRASAATFPPPHPKPVFPSLQRMLDLKRKSHQSEESF